VPKRKARTKPKKVKRAKRIDWTKRKAPARGSKLRADYERSAVFKARKKAAKKGAKTRAKKSEHEQRRLAKREKIERAKELLSPLLRKMIGDYQKGALQSHGQGMRRSKKAHGNWYAAKLSIADFMVERDFMKVLEELSTEHGLDEVGWDIIY
jgi:hypothetical protein